MLGEVAVAAALVPQHRAVSLDEEVAVAARDDLDLDVGDALPNGGGQTGRLRFVVSDYAVFDRHVHARKSGARTGQRQCRIGTRGQQPWP